MRNNIPGRKVFTYLLIEDDPAHAELIKRGFQEHEQRHQIIHIADGEAALDYLFRRGKYAQESTSPRPHVILLDLRLPRKSGFDVLKEVKDEISLRDIPVVVLTTSNAQEDARRAYELHANSFIVKPTDFNKFSVLMRDMGRYWMRWNYYSENARALNRVKWTPLPISA